MFPAIQQIFNDFLLIPGGVLDAEDTTVKPTNKKIKTNEQTKSSPISCLHAAYILFF
jgi:hypothetical protein